MRRTSILATYSFQLDLNANRGIVSSLLTVSPLSVNSGELATFACKSFLCIGTTWVLVLGQSFWVTVTSDIVDRTAVVILLILLLS